MIDQIAAKYVKLALALGQHDPYYVDAYYGPAEWKDLPGKSLREIIGEAQEARTELAGGTSPRELSLAKQLEALAFRARMVNGEKFSFSEESAALYDVVDSGRPDSYYSEVLAKLDPLLPGSGSITDRFDSLRAQFTVEPERLEQVFKAAIDAARERTKKYIKLPDHENFRVEYVCDQVWGAYNWYKGNAHSLIEVNTDFPITVDRAVGLACHEGYPGHHAYNALLEQHMVRENNWVEFTVYPLYSPQSLIAEGTAEYGVRLCFPSEERAALEHDVLYPLAGIDPSRVEEWSQILSLIAKLGYSSNDAASRYLDGKATRDETIDWLTTYALSTPARAEQRVRFIEANRSYVLTYNLGEDMVQAYVEKNASSYDEKWAVFTALLSTPVSASALN